MKWGTDIVMETSISDTIELNSYTAKYDASVKEMLADKQILARILKYSLDDFANEELSDIINYMDEPEVSQRRVEPGFSNHQEFDLYNKIMKTSEEDQVIGEGKIYYDIRFSIYRGHERIKILINIEAQKSTNPSKLGYHLDNRIIFYLGRMVSAQKEVEFHNSEYDDLKAVRSIWICMDSADDEDSINRMRLVQENVYGKEAKLDNLDKVQGVIIRLRANENAQTSKNELIAMLEELLKCDSAESKKRKLEEEYNIVMDVETERRVNTMCNLSEVVLERGEANGEARGTQREREKIAIKMIRANKPLEEIMEFTELSMEKLQELKQSTAGQTL